MSLRARLLRALRPPAPPETEEELARLRALVGSQQEDLGRLERRLSMALNALQLASAQAVEARSAAEEARQEARQAAQRATSALRTAEATAEGLDALEAALSTRRT